MIELKEATPNVAPQSTKGHFIKNAKKVYMISEIKEAFFTEGDGIMTSENHGTTPIKDGSLQMPQQVYNPYSKSLERSKD